MVLMNSIALCSFKNGEDVPRGSQSPANENTPLSIPLYVTSIAPGSIKVGIKLALGNTRIGKIYEFDTGSEGFFAAYQPDMRWWPEESITNLTGSQKKAMKYGSGTQFNFQLVKTAITFEGGTSLTANMGKILSSQKDKQPFQFTAEDWANKITTNQAPLYNRFYGIFGAALYLGNGSIWDGPDPLGTPLAQFKGIRGDGFIVRLNSSFNSPVNTQFTPTNELVANGELKIGLTDELRARFPIKLPMIKYSNPGSDIKTLPSGNHMYAEHSVLGKIKVSDAYGNTTSVPVYILFDTGATSIQLKTNYANPDDSPFMQFITKGKLIEGTTVTITVDGIDASSGWKWRFEAGRNIPTNMVKTTNDDTGKKMFLVVNQAAFFNNDFMFDIKNGVIGLAPKRIL